MSDGLTDWIHEALEPLGIVTVRKMFGGAGVYIDGAIVALLAFDEIWIKADTVSDPVFDAEGLDRFIYDFGDKKGTMNYRRVPSDAYDDADALQQWTRLGLAASARAPKRKARKA